MLGTFNQAGRIVSAVGLATILLTASTAFAEPAPDGEDVTPVYALYPDERAEFVDLYVDVFARGTVHLNDTPGAYPYASDLQADLIRDVVQALRTYNDTLAREFEPAFAGPKLGISTPDDPLTGLDGEPVTNETVDDVYGGLIGSLVFDREAFYAHLEEMVRSMAPDDVPDVIDQRNYEAEAMRNHVIEELEAEPIQRWSNDNVETVVPENFRPRVAQTLTQAPPLPEPTDLTRADPHSPFYAADPTAWADPQFRLTLPDLLDFLAGLTDLPVPDLLAALGLLSKARGRVVETVSGPLAAFPELAEPVRLLDDANLAVDAALATLTGPITIGLGEDADLPTSVKRVLNRVDQLAQPAMFAARVNAANVTGARGVPTPVDADGDLVPDVVITVTSTPEQTTVGNGGVTLTPTVIIERLREDTVTAPPAVGDGLVPSGIVPGTEHVPLDVVVAFRTDDRLATLVVAATLEGGDHLDAQVGDGVTLDVSLAGAPAAFDVTAARVGADGYRMAAVAGTGATATFHVETSVDPAAREATLTATATPPSAITIDALGADGDARVALSVTGPFLDSIFVDADDDRFRVDATEGSAFTVARHDGDAADVTTFTERTLAVTNAPSHTDALLAADEARLLLGSRGATVTASVADVDSGAYASGAWLEVAGAGRSFTFRPGAVTFDADRVVDDVRSVVATTGLAALVDFPELGTLRLTPDLTAFRLAGVSKVTAVPTSTGALRIDVANVVNQPFVIEKSNGADVERYLLSNLPLATTLDVTDGGLSFGGSSPIASLVAELTRFLDGPGLDPTLTVAAVHGLDGRASMSMLEATVNAFMDGHVGLIDMVSSNVMDAGDHVFERIIGNHALGDVIGLLRQHSLGLLDVAGSLLGGLFGVPGEITLDLHIDGELCQSFGTNGNRIEICFSNVPDHIAITFGLLPYARVVYEASEIIHELRVGLYATDLEILLQILEIPQRIELALRDAALSLTMSTRLAAILLTAEIGNITLAAGIEDIPTNVTLAWTEEGLDPRFDPDEYIGRVFLFVSTPGFHFFLDIVYIPLFTATWSPERVAFTPTGGRRIGSIRAQLVVENLTFLVEAEGIPGVAATWTVDGGTLGTTGPLDRFHTALTVADDLSLLVTLTDVPPLEAAWDDFGQSMDLTGGKIGEAKLQFVAGPLLVFLSAEGVPSLALTKSDAGFSLTAPTGIDAITAIVAVGDGYFDPRNRATDFVGALLRPEAQNFAVSARLTGIEAVELVQGDVDVDTALNVRFTADKDIQVLVNLVTSAFLLLADALITNLYADTRISFNGDAVNLDGTAAGEVATAEPWLQARLYLGTPDAFAELPEPRWPFETAGGVSGIMANTLIDADTAGIATKWKIYAPLPTSIHFGKETVEGVPSYDINAGVALGKLDLRTMLRVRIASQVLDTLVVVTVSNLPASLSVAQGIGDDVTSGNPDFTISTSEPIDNVFLGIRFDGRWYGRVMAEEPEFLDFGLPWVEWHGSAERDLGFPIWASLGDIPTAVAFSSGKGDWSGSDAVPFIQYQASASTLDASFWLDIGILWDTFVKSELLFEAGLGKGLPGWLKGLAKYDASGHVFVQIVDFPAQGILVEKRGDDLLDGIVVRVPDIPACSPGVGVDVCPVFADRLGKFFFDFNFRIEEDNTKQGCILCTSVLQLQWYYGYGWGLEIARLSLMLKDLKYLYIKPALETDLHLDGALLFDFRAGIDFHAGAGVALHIKLLGARILIFCFCLDFSFKFMIIAGFITFQILEKTWKLNYWTWFWPCGWDKYCDKHQYAGLDYTIPWNWRFDLGIYFPPLVDFRGLRLDSSDDGRGIQEYKVYLDPIFLTCVNTIAGIKYGPLEPCFGTHLIPPFFFMAYAFIKYFSISGPYFWSVKHKHG